MGTVAENKAAAKAAKEAAKATAKAEADKKKADAKAEKKAAADAAKAAAKANKPKRERLVKAFRKFKDSPAGHFADAMMATVGRLNKLAKKTNKWDPELKTLAEGAADGVTKLAGKLDALAVAGFKPVRGVGGRKTIRTQLKAGVVVVLSTECLSYLHQDFPSLSDKHTIVVMSSLQEGDKKIPIGVRASDGKVGPFLGRVSYKWLSLPTTAAPAVETETEQAAE